MCRILSYTLHAFVTLTATTILGDYSIIDNGNSRKRRALSEIPIFMCYTYSLMKISLIRGCFCKNSVCLGFIVNRLVV